MLIKLLNVLFSPSKGKRKTSWGDDIVVWIVVIALLS
ncbi:hypothetical protein SAMN05444000_12833 [Shimia gijangensis]|uniref:Uncharacterized protein n=1 Tax=Shimia gijangensis TaxID=1470563 RepID=A0A1M6SAF8_9RHOB|nr:hypothetical protein SAMN05444000_12833 [Shimia gijangensis]